MTVATTMTEEIDVIPEGECVLDMSGENLKAVEMRSLSLLPFFNTGSIKQESLGLHQAIANVVPVVGPSVQLLECVLLGSGIAALVHHTNTATLA